MKKSLALIFFSFLLLSCGKAFDIKTPDMILDGHAQTVEMKATALFGIQEIYEWHFNDSGDLVEDEFPKLDRQSTTEFAGDWYEVHVDKSDTRIARLTVTDNDSGTQRKITIHAECWGKGDSIRITQNSL